MNPFSGTDKGAIMSDAVQQWFLSGQYANIEGIDLIPTASSYLPDSPLFISMGQAEAYYIKASDDHPWILKKFKPGKKPNTQYIKAIKDLIPVEPGLKSGCERRVLSAASLNATSFYTPDLAAWLENAILMPMVSGCDWANIADQIRNEELDLTKEQRIWLCQRMSEKIKWLEQSGISHRDLSSTNILVDLLNEEVNLIDWDSLYHSTLSMPLNTTYGTSGYIAPFVRVNSIDLPQVSWAARSDRFSLAILNAEFLIMARDVELTGDGGAFGQEEIYSRRGTKLAALLDKVESACPKALALIERALNATTFDECPSPDEWIAATRSKAQYRLASADYGERQKFVSLNRSAFVQFNRLATVGLNREFFARLPIR
jgi:serine/threonine protein kinase